MKKSYVKPQVYFENFQLSASIAGTCGSEIDKSGALQADASSCVFDVGGIYGKLFLSESNCGRTPQDDELKAVCYQNPDAAHVLFRS